MKCSLGQQGQTKRGGEENKLLHSCLVYFAALHIILNIEHSSQKKSKSVFRWFKCKNAFCEWPLNAGSPLLRVLCFCAPLCLFLIVFFINMSTSLDLAFFHSTALHLGFLNTHSRKCVHVNVP